MQEENKEDTDDDKKIKREHIYCEFSCENCGSNEYWHKKANGEEYFLCVGCGVLYLVEKIEE